ncbi:hypothetical protein [Pseudonocardia sp. MH-G8]|uniref:hypothetical protein n=1 Tax=Pseudonocardia sp. MH-G8 TaxID=1854588 RepID=UPI0018E92F24|nr:hypothetical protein [Pseudonocardia sp. MH-G8]
MGGRFRDRVWCYVDTPSVAEPQEMADRLLERKRRGFTMLKMDVGISLLWDVPGTLIAPAGAREDTTMHPFTGIQVTPKGVEYLASYVDTVRSIVSYDVALATDHFGHIALTRASGSGGPSNRSRWCGRGSDPVAVHRPVAPAHRGGGGADVHG